MGIFILSVLIGIFVGSGVVSLGKIYLHVSSSKSRSLDWRCFEQMKPNETLYDFYFLIPLEENEKRWEDIQHHHYSRWWNYFMKTEPPLAERPKTSPISKVA